MTRLTRRDTPMRCDPPNSPQQVERFLDTENAALISMHYPQAQREVHFGTAPFNRGEDDEERDDGGLDGDEGGEESTDTGAGAAGAQGEDGGVPEGGYAGENVIWWKWRKGELFAEHA